MSSLALEEDERGGRTGSNGHVADNVITAVSISNERAEGKFAWGEEGQLVVDGVVGDLVAGSDGMNIPGCMAWRYGQTVGAGLKARMCKKQITWK